jgi:uncharacterized membrane protein
MSPEPNLPGQKITKPRPFRRAVLRGLAVVLPPLLTVVFFLWIGGMVNDYVLKPVTTGAREILVFVSTDEQIVKKSPDKVIPDQEMFNGTTYHILPSNADSEFRHYIPTHVYKDLADKLDADEKMPMSGKAAYRKYVELEWLQPQFVLPVFGSVFILVCYLLGKFLAAGLGTMALGAFERGVERIPFIRNVYGSVKQVTDFVFSESQVEYTRVIVCEYPRKGIWSLGMVTSDSMADLEAAANEEVLAVFLPTSPLPMTGYTVTIRKSEVIDLNITVDQALQYIVSCGVVVPPQQLTEAMKRKQEAAKNGGSPTPAITDAASSETDSILPASGS